MVWFNVSRQAFSDKKERRIKSADYHQHPRENLMLSKFFLDRPVFA